MVGSNYRYNDKPGKILALTTMQTNRRNNEIFSMSFLDVMCCGFGAMVLLVLLSKTDIVGGVLTENLTAELTTQQQIKQTQIQRQQELQNQLASIKIISAEKLDLKKINAQIAITENQISQLQNQNSPKIKPVGGIPVDSDHIIFLVDTSGSMQQQWDRVVSEIENILNIHPQVAGFQIMNDNGIYLIKSYARRWIPDTPKRRKSVLNLMKTWRSVSDSNPTDGIAAALKTYVARTKKLSIYVFGDDYSGGSYDPILTTIARLNHKNGKPQARIHGIGFIPPNHVSDKFATLMREVARQNRGAFVAMPATERSQISPTNSPNTN